MVTVATNLIMRFEAIDSSQTSAATQALKPRILISIRTVLEAAGIIFIKNGGGPDVPLRYRQA